MALERRGKSGRHSGNSRGHGSAPLSIEMSGAFPFKHFSHLIRSGRKYYSATNPRLHGCRQSFPLDPPNFERLQCQGHPKLIQ